MKLPTHVEEITPAWLTAALSEAEPGLKVDSADVVDVVHGACTKVRLALRTNRNDFPSTVLMKAGFETHSKYMAVMHFNEYHAYHDLVPTLDINTAKCHFAGEDGEGRALVILEDLCLRDVKFLSLQAPISFDLAARFLEALAKMHARWWNSTELGTKFPWLAKAHTKHMQVPYLDILEDQQKFDRYVYAPRGASMPRMLLDRHLVHRAHDRLCELFPTMPFTVTHGDTHLGNLYTDPDGTPGFLDYQPYIGPWSNDIAYFMTAGLDILDRRRWQGALLQHYLEGLKANGVTPPSFDDAFLSYRRSVIWGFVIWLMNSSSFQTEANNTAAATRFGMAMIDLDTLGALGL